MAYPAFTGGVANLNNAAIVAIYIRQSGGKWQTLGTIGNGATLNVKDLSLQDSLERNKTSNAYEFTAKAKMMESSKIEIQLLPTICNGANDFLFKLIDAVAITGSSVASAGWVQVNAAAVGVKGKANLDGSSSTDRTFELDFAGSIYKSDANEILLYTPSLQTTDFEATGSAGTFHAIGVYTATADGGAPNILHHRKNGFVSLSLDLAGGASPVAISPLNNQKLSFDIVGDVDGLNRPLPASVDIDAEYDILATLNADLLLVGNMTAVDVKAIITMFDGLIVTLDNNIGIESNVTVGGNAKKQRVISIISKGNIPVGSMSALFS